MGDRTRAPQKGEWCLGRGRALQVGSSKSLGSDFNSELRGTSGTGWRRRLVEDT